MSVLIADWKQYICRACGVIYDEELGDPDSGIAAGTRFDAIPDERKIVGVGGCAAHAFLPRPSPGRRSAERGVVPPDS